MPPWFNEYIGIPFSSYDCWGLFRLIQQEQFGNSLPEFKGMSCVDPLSLRLIEDNKDGLGVRTDQPIPGDCALLLRGSFLAHIGVYAGFQDGKEYILDTTQVRGHSKLNLVEDLKRYTISYYKVRQC